MPHHAPRHRRIRRQTPRPEGLESRQLLASFQGLGDLPGGDTSSFVSGISADGSTVIGWSNGDVSGGGAVYQVDRAFRWTGGALQPLAGLPGTPTDTYAYGVSADGSTVVGSSGPENALEAFRWTAGGGTQTLSGIPADVNLTVASGVSADGSLVVGRGAIVATSPPQQRGFRWTQAGGLVKIGTLPGTAGTTGVNAARGVSADGSVLVGLSNTPTGVVAFRQVGNAAPEALQGPAGATRSEAFAVSGNGAVIVGTVVSPAGTQAFRWDATNGMVQLGDLPGDAVESIARATNADGSIVVGVGRVGPGNAGLQAFIWDATNGMRSLADVLQNTYGLNLNGMTLSAAVGISADGTRIVGQGINASGKPEAWYADLRTSPPPPPPPPVTYATISSVGATGARNRPPLNTILVDFGQVLNATTARRAASYVLVDLGRDGRLGTRDDRRIRIRRVTYTSNATTPSRVALTLQSALRNGGRYVFTVASGANGVATAAGQPLDGNADGTPGDNFVKAFRATRRPGPLS